MREERLDKAGALAWLEQQGFLSNLSGRGRFGAYGSGSGKTVLSESPYSPANQGNATMTHCTQPKRDAALDTTPNTAHCGRP